MSDDPHRPDDQYSRVNYRRLIAWEQRIARQKETDASIAGKEARKILQSCEAPELIARSGTCGGAIVDVLFELLPNSHKSLAEHESRNILKDARKSLDAKCS